MPGRTLVIGDIHGCHVALEVLLAKLQPTTEDTVVLLGDIVDRGPGTRQVIECLLKLRGQCLVIFIMGNHEEMMLSAMHGGPFMWNWLRCGGQEVLDSYGGWLENIPEAHWDFLRSAVDYWESASDIFVHANLEPGVPLREQSADWLRWIKYTGFEPPHPSGKRVICGHTAQKTGLPAMHEGWLCLDTWVYGDGWLTGLDLGANLVYQARQTGQSRGGVPLDELL